jgi:hypothetical protein
VANEITTLYSMVVEDLAEARASRFLRRYIQRTDVIYRESESRSFKDAAVYEAYQAYLYGQIRFALHQSMFVNLAEECGVDWNIARSPHNGFPTAVVKVGRFYFTDHYGFSAHEIACINPSLMRQQASAVNLSLTQGNLFEAFDDSKLQKAESIYGNFIHGCRGTGSTFADFGFVRLAFPCVTKAITVEDAEKSLRFIENHDLHDVLKSVVEIENHNREQTKKREITIATPKLKKLPGENK